MALLTCRECGHDVSDSAQKCPNCGAKQRLGPVGTAFVWTFGGFATLLIIGSIAGQNHPAQQSDPKELAPYACGEFVKQHLRDPDSADFLESRAVPAQQLHDGSFVMMLQVRGNNGFGGKTMSSFSCTMDNAGGNWHLQHMAEIGEAGAITVIFDDGVKH